MLTKYYGKLVGWIRWIKVQSVINSRWLLIIVLFWLKGFILISLIILKLNDLVIESVQYLNICIDCE